MYNFLIIAVAVVFAEFVFVEVVQFFRQLFRITVL